MPNSSMVYDKLPKVRLACPLCHGEEFEVLCKTDRYRMGISTARCSGCGLIMTNPVPSAEALEEFYSQHYRNYYRKLERPDLRYIQRYALGRRAEHTVEYLGSSGLLGAKTQVIDVGCGEGSLNRSIRRHYPTATTFGVEPYEPFAEFARSYSGCPIFPTLDRVPEHLNRSFGLVIVSYVLEHILEPVEFLRQIKTLLKPTGKIFIDVPDICKYHWLADLHIAHIYHFSFRTLARTVEAAGFKVERMEAHRPPRLPRCIRVSIGQNGESITIPDTTAAEDAAADRIRRMHRWAVPFSLGFRLVMAAYDWGWNIFSRLSSMRRSPSSAEPTRDGHEPV